jgi:hypothetical protein
MDLRHRIQELGRTEAGNKQAMEADAFARFKSPRELEGDQCPEAVTEDRKVSPEMRAYD